MLRKPLVAISCGDPAGIGAEIAIKVASNKKIREVCQPVITGAKSVLKEAIKLFSPHLNLIHFDKNNFNDNDIFYEDFGCLSIGSFRKGENSSEAGELAYQTIVHTTEAVKEKIFDTIVTAPVSKEAINLAGYKFQGHTELIARLCGCDNFIMMQSSAQLNVAFMSNHIGLARAVDFITEKRFIEVARLFQKALMDMKGSAKIAVAGFNPHAGENGFISCEENQIIIPAIQKLLGEVDLAGPFPADTLFIESMRQQFDGIICMYHDQGHIPFKMLCFETGVNCTLGLPIIRTSVDHGTAFDIAWQGKAFSKSLEEAVIKSIYFFNENKKSFK